MNRTEFWNLIDTARTATNDDPDAQSEHLTTLLKDFPDEELISFHEHFYTLYNPTYRADLWGAAYILNGGCSDDGFDYFRAWLIGRGQAAYDAALVNPDSLAEVTDDDFAEQEDLLQITMGIWLKRKNKTWGDDTPFPHIPQPDLIGDLADWDEDEEKLEKLYPRLFAKFG